ncbi:MAG TPA: hypothetical protein VMV49_13985 [Candidatus Deferrimicrobium sp.]|nr:hypothetical protein [Candidatus Deferrimicrobium sp.]
MSELGIKERDDKDKYDSTLDSLVNENVFIMKYLYENFSMEEVEKYCKWDVDLSVERRIGPLKNALIQMLNKLAKKTLLNQFIKTLIDEGQFLIPLKCFELVEIGDKSGKIIINKCPAKKRFNKAVKKLGCKDHPWAAEDLGYCKYWCSPLFQKFLNYIKVPLTIEYTDKGCIIIANFEKYSST